MRKQQALAPAGFGALVIAVLACLPAYAVAQAAAPEAPAPKPQATLPMLRGGDDDHVDTFDVLAESLGVDISEEGLIRRVRGSLRQLGENPEPEARSRAIAVLHAFFALQLRQTASLEPARTSLRNIEESSRGREPRQPSHQDVETIERFVEAYFNRDALTLKDASAEDVLLANDFHTLDRRAFELDLLQRAASQQEIAVHFLIATLPDPIDSFTGWQFDPMLDAITQAITSDEYLFDRAHFPDVGEELEPAPAQAAENGHDIEPGVVVFRRRLYDSQAPGSGSPRSEPAGDRAGPARPVSGSHADRLVLLTVHENPAAGVHARALANAIRLIASWPLRTKGDDVIRILGPTFSGSSESIARALRMTRRALTEQSLRVRVVSGSATDAANQRVIQGALEGMVTFQATVRPDTELIPALVEHLRGAGFPGGERVAVLFEANTQYGRQVGELIDRALSKGDGEILRLPFPMNISRLRTTAPATTGAAAGSSAPSRFRRLTMEASQRVTDQIHQFKPETTATYMELALADLVDTIDRERIGTVALLATDPRDKLFLAQQIARYSPDVSIVTTESDSIYTHPDYASYLQGALVVSSYPLWNDNQRLAYGFEGGRVRRQFANGSAQGVYNAVLALLEYTEDGKPLSSAAVDDLPQPLLEYGPPLEDCTYCAPAIWISTIGYNRPWAVRAMVPAAPASGAPQQYVFHVRRQPSKPFVQPVSSQPLGPTLFAALCAVLVVGTLVHMLHPRFALALAGSDEGLDERRDEGSAYLLAAWLGLAALQVLALAAVAVSWRANGPKLSVVTASVALAAALVAQLVLSARLVQQAARASARLWNGAVTSKRVTGLAVAALVLWAIVNVIGYGVGRAREPHADSMAFLARTLDLSSGVSPVVPLILLISSFVVWAFVEHARTRRPEVVLASDACKTLLGQAVHGDVKEMAAGWKGFNQSLLGLSPRLLVVGAVPVIVTIALICDPIVRPLVTIEGRAYGRVIAAALLGLQLLVTLALLQFVHLWSGLRSLLRAMAWHPLAAAYHRVPRRLFPSGMLPRTPRLMELETLVAQSQQCAAMGAWTRTNAAVLLTNRGPLRATYEQEMSDRAKPQWSGSETWKAIAVAKFDQPPGAASPIGASGAGTALALAPAPAAAPARPAAHQTLIAMAMALVVRDALARLNYNAVFVAIGSLILFCSQTLFPFQLHRRLAILGWSYIGVTFLTLLVALVQIKRNEVIQRLSAPVGGESAHWDIALILKIAFLVIVPLLTLFAAQFPSVGGTILQWLEPVQKALP